VVKGKSGSRQGNTISFTVAGNVGEGGMEEGKIGPWGRGYREREKVYVCACK